MGELQKMPKFGIGKDFETSSELTPGFSMGVPFQDWECKYCQYNSICPINK